VVEVTFLSSVQGYQDERVRSLATRLAAEKPEVRVSVIAAADSGTVLAKYKLKFGPAILLDGRVEFVGIPRFRMLVERIATSRTKEPAPRSVMRGSKTGGTGE